MFLLSTPEFLLNIGNNTNFFGSRNTFSGVMWKQRGKANGFITLFKNFMLCNGIKGATIIGINHY